MTTKSSRKCKERWSTRSLLFAKVPIGKSCECFQNASRQREDVLRAVQGARAPMCTLKNLENAL